MNTVMNSFENLKLNTKLGLGLVLGLGSMMVIIVALGMQALASSRQQSNEIRRVYELELQGVSQIKGASIHLMQMDRSLRQMILSPDAKSLAVAHADLDNARAVLRSSLLESDKLFFHPEGRALLARIGDVSNQYLRTVDHVTELRAQNGALQNNEITGYLASPENVGIFKALETLMSNLVRHKETGAYPAAQDAIESCHQIERLTLLLLLLLGSAAGLISGVLLATSLRRNAERQRLSVENLAHGQFQTLAAHSGFDNEDGANQADAQRWSKTQATLIGAKVRAIEGLGEFADTLLAQLTPVLRVQLGLLYVWDGALGKYRYQGSAGLALDSNRLADFAPGEGLLGQCARDAKPMQVDAIGAGSLRICSGLIDDRPCWIYLMPVIDAEGVVLAVLELGSIAPLGERQQMLLQEVLQMVARDLKIIERHRISQALVLQSEQRDVELRKKNLAIEYAKNRSVGSTLPSILNDVLVFSKSDADKMKL